MRKIFKCLLLLLSMVAGSAFADAVPVNAISTAGSQIRDRQLREIRDVLRGGRGWYFDMGTNYFPLSSQTPLESKFGEHDGFVSRQHFAAFGAGNISPDGFLGFMLWFDRSGWDSEDYIFFPEYSDFSLIRSNFTWGFSYTHKPTDLTFALGMQHQNVENVGHVFPHENDSLLYFWAHARWSHFSLQGSFHRTHLNSLRLSLDLESRSVYGGRKDGFLTYLPNIDATYYKRDIGGEEDNYVRVNWEQNLYKQILYAEVAVDFPNDGFRSAALKYYVDPSRMMAFEASCLRRNSKVDGSKDLLFGGAIDILFLRIGYNSATDYDNLFHAKGTVTVDIKFSMASIDGMFFGRKAAQPAPMETVNHNLNLKKFMTDHKITNGGAVNSETKTIEAKGIRYENSGDASFNGGK